MTVTIDYLIDFASPNSYLANKVLPDIAARTGAKVNYIPVLLGGIFKATNNKAPWMVYAEVPNKLAYERLEMTRFIEKHKLTKFRLNSNFPMNTLLAMRAATAAQKSGQLDEFIQAVETAAWEDDVNIADPEALAGVLTAHGLDGRALVEATQDPEIKAALIANTDAALERKVFGIPTFFVGDEMFFGKDRLGQLEEAVIAAS